MRTCTLLALAVLAASPLRAQNDFLTADEIDQVREAQEPNTRLNLYVAFAKLRIELVRQLVAKEKAGRSIIIHDQLDQYTKIIEAIDTVADDAIRRKVDVTEGMKAVAGAEKEMLAVLRKVEESAPKDVGRYQFVLKNAIDTTEDSAELSQQDMNTRTADVAAKDERDRKERQSLSTPEKAEEAQQDEKKAASETKKQRKVPSLRRKGEIPPDKK